jgi:hypothetical protein
LSRESGGRWQSLSDAPVAIEPTRVRYNMGRYNP